MTVRQISHQFRHHLEADKKAVQGVLVELVGTAEQIVEQRIFALHVADEQSPGELVLVLEVIKESAFDDADSGNQFLNRRGREPLFQNRGFRHIENSLARVAALTRRLLHVSFSPAPEMGSTVPRVHLKTSEPNVARRAHRQQNANLLNITQIPNLLCCTASRLEGGLNKAHRTEDSA